MEMLHNKTATRQLSCAADYCAECCEFHTSLLSVTHKMRCEEGCMRNRDPAHSTEASFISRAQRCARGNDKLFFLCSQVR